MRTHAVRILLVVFALALPVSVYAQTPQFTRSQPVPMEFDYPVIGEAEFFTYTISGTGFGFTSPQLPVSIVTSGVGRFTMTAPSTTGTYTIVARAANTDSISDPSDPVTFQVVKGQPAKPGKPRPSAQTSSIRGTMQDYARAALRQPEPAPDPVAFHLNLGE